MPTFRMRLGESRWLDASEMASCEISVSDGVTTIVWRGHPEGGADFEVVGTVRDEDGVAVHRLRWSGYAGVDLVERVEYPVAEAEVPGVVRLLYPAATGAFHDQDLAGLAPGCELLDEWLVRPRSFHFVAVMDPAGRMPSHYLDQRGAREWATEMHIRHLGPGRVELASVFAMPVSRETSAAYELPIASGVCRLARPSWYDAAMTYRRYLETEPWFQAAKKRDLGRLAEIGVWVWNRGLAENVIPPCEKLRDLTGVPVALDWYWWHANPYDTDYPFFWPPREGEENFRKAVRRLNDGGIFAQTYVNGLMWDEDGPGWKEGGLPAAKLRRDGTYRSTAWCVFNRHRLSVLCSESPVFQGEIRKVVRHLADCGLPSQYLDCIGNGGTGECWNPAHAHPSGGGCHQVDGWRRFMRDIKGDNPGLRLSTEEPSEPYMDLCDSFICVVSSFERFNAAGGMVRRQFLPVASVLYHGLAAFFGGFTLMDGLPPWDPRWPDDMRWKQEQEWPRMFPDQFAVEFARSVVWGLQPVAHNLKMENFDDPLLKDDIAFLVEGAKFHHAHLDFLFSGDMLDPGEMHVGVRDVKFFVRTPYTKEGEFKVSENQIPAVLHSLWRAPGGRVAAVLVNWTRETVHCDLAAPDLAFACDMPPRSGLLKAAE